MTRRLDSLYVLVAILALWEALFLYAGDVAITPPDRAIPFAVKLLTRATFWGHAAATGLAVLYALSISALGGVAIGLLLGIQRFTADVTEPILASLYTIPKITLYPVILLLFGLGISAKIAFGVLHGIFPVILFTLAAVKSLPPVLLRSARALHLTPAQTATRILLPAVLPEIITGLRVGFALTILGVLIGEMFASQRGLGFLIINGINAHDVRMTTTVAMLVVLIAILANGALLRLDRRVHHTN